MSYSYQQMLDEHRRRLVRVVERRGVGEMKKLYSDAHSELIAKLGRIAPGTSKYTVHQHNLMLSQVRQGMAVIGKRMRGELGDISLHAQTEALRGLASDFAKLEKHYTGAEITLPIEEAGRFRGLITGKRESLMRSHTASIARYMSSGMADIEDKLSLSLMTGETITEAADRVSEVVGGKWWEAERVARTELMGAFNVAQRDGIRDSASEIPDLMMRWVEFVDDSDYSPLDDRVSIDSIMMHGQIAPPGGMFFLPKTLPSGEPVSEKEMKRIRHLYAPGQWTCPPNRPNDRSSISPWRPNWGIPGWRIIAGNRVDVEQT